MAGLMTGVGCLENLSLVGGTKGPPLRIGHNFRSPRYRSWGSCHSRISEKIASYGGDSFALGIYTNLKGQRASLNMGTQEGEMMRQTNWGAYCVRDAFFYFCNVSVYRMFVRA